MKKKVSLTLRPLNQTCFGDCIAFIFNLTKDESSQIQKEHNRQIGYLMHRQTRFPIHFKETSGDLNDLSTGIYSLFYRYNSHTTDHMMLLIVLEDESIIFFDPDGRLRHFKKICHVTAAHQFYEFYQKDPKESVAFYKILTQAHCIPLSNTNKMVQYAHKKFNELTHPSANLDERVLHTMVQSLLNTLNNAHTQTQGLSPHATPFIPGSAASVGQSEQTLDSSPSHQPHLWPVQPISSTGDRTHHLLLLDKLTEKWIW